MTTSNVFNLHKLYSEYFGRENYLIAKESAKDKNLTIEVKFNGIPKNPHPKGKIHFSKTKQPFNKIGLYGENIWHPIKLQGFEMQYGQPTIHTLEIEICTVSVKLNTGIVSTPIANRKGCVNEIVNLDNYKFTVRGFLIGENRKVPEEKINKLKYFQDSLLPVEMHAGFVEIFLHKSCKIQMTKLDFPEVQGGNHWIRPFSFECESDFVEDLEF